MWCKWNQMNQYWIMLSVMVSSSSTSTGIFFPTSLKMFSGGIPCGSATFTPSMSRVNSVPFFTAFFATTDFPSWNQKNRNNWTGFHSVSMWGAAERERERENLTVSDLAVAGGFTEQHLLHWRSQSHLHHPDLSDQRLQLSRLQWRRVVTALPAFIQGHMPLQDLRPQSYSSHRHTDTCLMSWVTDWDIWEFLLELLVVRIQMWSELTLTAKCN